VVNVDLSGRTGLGRRKSVGKDGCLTGSRSEAGWRWATHAVILDKTRLRSYLMVGLPRTLTSSPSNHRPYQEEPCSPSGMRLHGLSPAVTYPRGFPASGHRRRRIIPRRKRRRVPAKSGQGESRRLLGVKGKLSS